MIRQIAHHITRRHLTRLNKEHLGQFPQVANFSFDLISHFIHMDGRFEKDELDFLARVIFGQLPKAGVCLDLGANIGNHSLAFSPHFSRVIAFEPHPRTFRLLQMNAELAPNVTALNLGASSAKGVISVGQDPQNLAATGLGRDGVASMARVDFQLVRIDDLADVQQAGPVTFMKIDVEGHEALKVVRTQKYEGNCYDNSKVEAFFKSIKAEQIWRNFWDTRRQAEGAMFQYIHGFYNPQRRHSSLGGKSRLAFERKAA